MTSRFPAMVESLIGVKETLVDEEPAGTTTDAGRLSAEEMDAFSVTVTSCVAGEERLTVRASTCSTESSGMI